MAMGFGLVKQNVTSSALDPTSTLHQEEIAFVSLRSVRFCNLTVSSSHVYLAMPLAVA